MLGGDPRTLSRAHQEDQHNTPLLVELPISLDQRAFLLSRVCAFIHTTAVEPLSSPDGRESTPK